jgi:hypothetical protein
MSILPLASRLSVEDSISRNGTTLPNTGLLDSNYSTALQDSVTLVKFSPRNHLDVLPELAYPYSNYGYDILTSKIETMSYPKKASLIKQLLAREPSQHYTYTFEVIDTTKTILWIMNTMKDKNPGACQLQHISPRLGYDIPESIEKANLGNMFEESFDMSLQLHSQMQGQLKEEDEALTCLLGHRARLLLTLNYSQLIHIVKARESSAANHNFVDNIIKSISNEHPQIGELLTQH